MLELSSFSYWSECSGAVEHYYKKFGGVMIPNDYIELFIGNKFESKCDDGYHFNVRYVASDKEDDDTIIQKVIFGFNNKETYELIKQHLDSSILKQINYIMNSTNEKALLVKRDKYQAAHDIIYVFYEEKCQVVNEFSQEFLDILQESLETLESYVINNLDDNRKEKFEIAIWNAHDILNTSTALEFHQI